MGRPSLSMPCANILFCAISFATSDSEIEPLGTKVIVGGRCGGGFIGGRAAPAASGGGAAEAPVAEKEKEEEKGGE
ncbi:hypothetical protein ACS0TY_034968 [Phlomoides rotata]